MDLDRNDASLDRPLLVTPADALYGQQWLALPAPDDPAMAARLRIARGTYPLPTVLVGRRRMVRTIDIRNYVARLTPDGHPVSSEPESNTITRDRRTGRPRKIAVPGGAP